MGSLRPAAFPQITLYCIECSSFLYHRHAISNRPHCRCLCFSAPLSDLMWTFKKAVFKELVLRPRPLLLPLLMPLHKQSLWGLHSGRQVFTALLGKEDVVVWKSRVSLQINCTAVSVVCWQGKFAACLFLSYTMATACSLIYTFLTCILVMFVFMLQFWCWGVLGM